MYLFRIAKLDLKLQDFDSINYLWEMYLDVVAAVIHPFGEHIAYFMLFAIPMLTAVFSGTASIAS